MGEIDYGHYVERSLPSGDGTLVVPEGTKCRKVVVLRRQGERIPFSSMVMEAGAEADVCLVVMPGVSVDVWLSVDMVGEGASLNLEGLYLCGGDEKVTISTEVRHRVGMCKSSQLFNGIATGKSHAGFFGRIVVAPDAQKTEAYQASHNLLLSPDAVVDAKPELEIYADDVRCSHGATTGSLNEDEQFYMRSRGVPEMEAKVLQMISFVAPVLSHIGPEQEKAELFGEIEQGIRRLV